MWSAITSDLSEFVSTVTVDTQQALSRMDQDFDEKNQAAISAMAAATTDPTITSDSSGNNQTEASAKGDEEMEEEDLSAAEAEAIHRMSLPETFTTPLLSEVEEKATNDDEEDKSPTPTNEESDADDKKAEKKEYDYDDEDDEEIKAVKVFLKDFDISAKTEEIALLLQTHSDTLQVQFETLVPTTVTYQHFWERFYYRCDKHRIAREWAEEDKRKRERRAQAVSAGISTVRNFLGGAVKAVANTLSEDDSGDILKKAGKAVGGADGGAGGTSSWFSNARPPFVMNTAVDEDDDEDKEELGWDDDDEEEDGDDEDIKDDDEDVVEFRDEAVEKLQEQLNQVTSERDQLQATVAMQAKELAALATGDQAHFLKHVEELKTKLFEKEAELAAVKASKLDDSVDAAQASSNSEELLKKEEELKEMESVLQVNMEEMKKLVGKAEQDNLALDEAHSQIAKLQAQLSASSGDDGVVSEQIDFLAEKVTALESDKSSMRDEVTSIRSQLTFERSEKEAALKHSREIESQLKETKNALAEMERAKKTLEQEVTSLRNDLPKLGGTETTNKINDDDDDDGWGDDWGEDE